MFLTSLQTARGDTPHVLRGTNHLTGLAFVGLDIPDYFFSCRTTRRVMKYEMVHTGCHSTFTEHFPHICTKGCRLHAASGLFWRNLWLRNKIYQCFCYTSWPGCRFLNRITRRVIEYHTACEYYKLVLLYFYSNHTSCDGSYIRITRRVMGARVTRNTLVCD